MSDMINTMKEGFINHSIEILKDRLNNIGYDCGYGPEFDRRTAWAVRWFRRRNRLPEGDGVDAIAWESIQRHDATRGCDDGFVYYSMKDPMWAEYPYKAANTQTVETVGTSGCGPTSMAMAVSTALQRAVLPPVLADWANARGYRDPNGEDGTDPLFFPACAESYGLKAVVYEAQGKRSFEHIRDELAKRNAIIANVREGSPYTKVGHYNLISAIEDDRVVVCDSVPKNMDLPSYTVDTWLKQRILKNYTVVSR